MKEIVLATRNNKKLLELKRLLKGAGVGILSLDDFKGLPNVKEDGKNFRENAAKKAIEISSRIDKLVMADDSGLCVPALGNAPGLHSARYAGPAQDDSKNIAKLLREMKSFTGAKRNAYFTCTICISKGRKIVKIVEGKVYGRITVDVRGAHGFGYDPVFIPRGYDKTFAELGHDIKDRISHRSIALRKARDILLNLFQKGL